MTLGKAVNGFRPSPLFFLIDASDLLFSITDHPKVSHSLVPVRNNDLIS